jgi:hypothetical protein
MNNNPLKPLQAGSRPLMASIPNPTCPILLEAKAVFAQAQDLHKAVRRLRRSTQRCPTCPEKAECPTLSYFAEAVDTAIRELRAEWGLDHE